MNSRMLTAPRWALCLIFGVAFAAIMTGYRVVDDTRSEGPLDLLIIALISGIPFGLILGWTTTTRNRGTLAAAGPLEPAEQHAAARAIGSGPVPADPDVRLAARRIITKQLDDLESQQTLSLWILGVCAVGFLAAAFFVTPWLLLAAAGMAVSFVYSRRLPARLERRLLELAD